MPPHTTERPLLDTDDATLVALVGRVRFGDADALAQLYDLTLGRVYALALRILADPRDAEEAVADVYLQVWDHAVRYCPARGAVMAWLQTLAWSRALDLRRKRQRASRGQVHPDAAGMAYMVCEDPTPERLADYHGRAREVREALATLSPAQREVLALTYTEELSHAEIAQKTGLPLGTVKSHARRGLASLRAALLGTDPSP